MDMGLETCGVSCRASPRSFPEGYGFEFSIGEGVLCLMWRSSACLRQDFGGMEQTGEGKSDKVSEAIVRE
jgi:hypothetical protein